MKLIKLDNNEILSERAGYEYHPDKSYEYVVTIVGTDDFLLHRSIRASSAQEAHLKAAEEVHQLFQPIVTPRILSGDLILSQFTDENSNRQDTRMHESYVYLKVQLWDDTDIKIQYPEIYDAHVQVKGYTFADFSLILRLYNDYNKAMENDSYKGKSFREAINQYPQWWDIQNVLKNERV